MKKVIAISVVFVLVVGAAFADASFGGQLQIGATLVAGKGDDDPTVGPITVENSMIKVAISEEKAGGVLAIDVNGGYSTGFTTFRGKHAFFWWTPIPQLRLQIGQNLDGDYGAAQITDWGFTAEAKNGSGAVNDYQGGLFMNGGNRGDAFYGGSSDWNLNFQIRPGVEGLSINLIFPLSGPDFASTYLSSHVNIVYGIADIGTARISLKLNGTDADDKLNPVDFYGSFYLVAIDDMGVDIGVAYEGEVLKIGLGFRYAGGDFGFKLRAGTILTENAPTIAFGILPSYNLGALTAYLQAGLGMRLPDVGDTEVDWFVNPYISANAGGITLYSGFQLQSKSEVTSWGILFGFNKYF